MSENMMCVICCDACSREPAMQKAISYLQTLYSQIFLDIHRRFASCSQSLQKNINLRKRGKFISILNACRNKP